jgi:hypothetical protein
MMATGTTLPDEARRAAEQDCAQLVIGFAFLIDHRRYDELVALFADDCSFDRPGVPKAVGKDGIRAFLAARPDELYTRHLCGTPFFESVTSDSAKAVTYMTLFMGEGPQDVPLEVKGAAGVAEIQDHFVHTAQGWRLGHRKIIPAVKQNN